MRRGVVTLGNQIQENFAKMNGFVDELNLTSHPLGQTLSDLREQTDKLLAMLKTDSRNSSLPPSQDQFREKACKAESRKKPGGQPGHKGARLTPFENPDKIVELAVDTNLLTSDAEYVGIKKAQVVEYESRRVVIEYRSPVYRLKNGVEITATFPKGVTSDIQYGQSVKASVVYDSVYQLIPYRRITEIFSSQIGIFLSEGSVYNFLKDAYEKLEDFESWLRNKLMDSAVLHMDETGINIGGKNFWVHTVGNERHTLLFPHKNRGREAIEAIAILPGFAGIVCHDCWPSYFAYNDATHVLCNAHIMRELKGAHEKYGCHWAKLAYNLFEAMHRVWKDSGGSIPEDVRKKFRKRYRALLTKGEKECGVKKEKGKQKRTKPQNLLIRLREYEDAVLRFLEDPRVPFTNNLAENSLRMTKVQQKISGCFRTLDGARYFCRIRSYLSTCMKNEVSPTEALNMLFDGKFPDFIDITSCNATSGE